MDNFYVTLVSNNKSDDKNTSSSFRTYLPYSLQLQGEWECALVELSFQRSWDNFSNENDELEGFKQTGFQLIVFDEIDNRKWHMLNVTPGHFDSIKDLLENIRNTYQEWALNEDDVIKLAISDLENHIERFRNSKPEEHIAGYEEMLEKFKNKTSYLQSLQIDYDNNRKRVVLRMDNRNLDTIEFSSHLAYTLGLKNEMKGAVIAPTDKISEIIATYPCNLTVGTNSLYIYTDIIEPNIVGDSMARLLRIVNGSGTYGEYVTRSFTRPYYIPVAYSSINRIEVELKDEMNRLIRFSYGITILKLHFQKKKRFPIII